MQVATTPEFDTPDLAALLADLPDDALDALPYGVIEMDLQGTVRRYNATESQAAGLAPERVLGRHFFREVAPCCNNRHVAERFAQDTQDGLDETLAYTFSLRMRPVPVVLRLLRPAGGTLMHMLVRRDGATGRL